MAELFGGIGRWIGVTLERRIAVYSVSAIVGICLFFGALSFLSTLWIIQQHQRENQEGRLARIIGYLDTHLDMLVSQTQNLSKNPLVPTALLDSSGRDVYLQPFFANYRFSIPELHGLALCDFEGKPLAQQKAYPVGCFTGSSQAGAVVDTEQPQTALIPIGGALHAVFFQPVLYPGTNRAEGYLVAALNLDSMIEDANLAGPNSILILNAADGQILHAARAGQAVAAASSPGDLSHPLFAQGLFATAGLALALHEPANLLQGFEYLLMGYGVGTLVLIALAWLISHRTAHSLVAPLIALNDTARKVATEGPGAGTVIVDRDDEIGQLAASFNNMVVALGREQGKLEYRAYHDALTELPNRLLLSDRMQQAMARARRGKDKVAVCYLDLDGFKPVNDRYGHRAGDRLLVEVARRLRTMVRSHDTPSRLGGDEFVLLLTDIRSRGECQQILARIAVTLATPYELENGVAVSISASVGVALYPDDNVDADVLLRHADQAMYQAKQAGRNNIRFFDSGGIEAPKTRRSRPRL